MSDKLRRTYPINITLASGEQPTAAKLTAIATQARNGLAIIENAIGDIWGQAGDTFFDIADDASKRKRLHIASVGRATGNMDKVGPKFDYIAEDIRFYDGFTGSLNTNVGSLHMIVNGSLTWSGKTVETSNPLNVDASADAYYDSDTGKVFSYNILSAGDTPYYSTQYSDFPAESKLAVNFIPPATQDSSVGFAGCKVVAKDVDGSGNPVSGNTRYYLVLPPRVTDSGHNNPNIDDYYVGVTNNEATSTSATPKRYFWEQTTAIATDSNSEHYRYRLPSVLSYSSFTAGSRLPDGFLRLWDDNAGGSGIGKVIDGIVFYKPETSDVDHGSTYYQNFVVEIDAPNYVTELDALCSKDAEYTASDYNTGIRIITTGSSLAECIEDIYTKLYDHNHSWPGNELGISSRIRHKDLMYLDPVVGTSSPFYLVSGKSDVRLLKSVWPNDDHLQYLSRAGSQDFSSTESRDIYNNAMLGDLLIGSTSAGTKPFYNNLSADSHKLYFGIHSASAPRLYYDQSQDTMVLENKSLSLENGVLNLYVSSSPHSKLVAATDGSTIGLKLLDSSSVLNTRTLTTGKLRADNSSNSTPSATNYALLSHNALGFSDVCTISTGSITLGSLTLDSAGGIYLDAVSTIRLNSLDQITTYCDIGVGGSIVATQNITATNELHFGSILHEDPIYHPDMVAGVWSHATSSSPVYETFTTLAYDAIYTVLVDINGQPDDGSSPEGSWWITDSGGTEIQYLGDWGCEARKSTVSLTVPIAAGNRLKMMVDDWTYLWRVRITVQQLG